MEIDFELVVEGISLGLDVVILGFLYKSYESCCTYIDALKVNSMFFAWPIDNPFTTCLTYPFELTHLLNTPTKENVKPHFFFFVAGC